MKLIGERVVVSAGRGEGEVVVVGVKLDSKSKELLTWTLLKVARTGDRVIALHVLDSDSELVGGTAALLSLVKTFDSLLSAYEGFCNLKQVELKLKICRGPSLRKILVREAIASGAAKLVLGAKDHRTISSSTSVAKYCARKFANSVSVFAVRNGKVRFQKEAILAIPCSSRGVGRYLSEISNQEAISSNEHSSENLVNLSHLSTLAYICGAQAPTDSAEEGNDNDRLDPVPFQRIEAVSNCDTKVDKGPSESKRGWSFLGGVLLPQRHNLGKSHSKKASAAKGVLKLPSRNSSSLVYPDKKQISICLDDHSSDLEAENGAIVPNGSSVVWSPMSPCCGSSDLPSELKGFQEKYSSSCRLFSYEELLLATSNFMFENLIGKGGSGHVYKGCLPDGKELAVKILRPSENVLKEFVVEVETITTLHHKNIISLFGFCFEHNNLILVYDFLLRGSLEENLHGNKKDHEAFGWHERYKVAVGVADALDYLHNGCDQPVIHRDVKSSNILLSDDFEPQLSDFGLSSRVSKSSPVIICTDVTGTFGYLAPEYFMHGKVSDKADVFSFGVVLLELLSGRMAINSKNAEGQESLVIWAKPIIEGDKVSELLDSQLGSEYDMPQIERMVLAANLCLRRSPRLRPQISLILKLLQGDEETASWARKQIGSSEIDCVDEEAFSASIQTHLNLALLDLEDDSLSISSTEQGGSIEDYLRTRLRRELRFN